MNDFLFFRYFIGICQWRALLLVDPILDDPNSSPPLSPPNAPAPTIGNPAWIDIARLGAIALLIGLTLSVGFFSRKVEHAIVFALISSLILIGLFFAIGQ